MESITGDIENEIISKKFIRTVSEKIPFCNIKGGLVLPYEHIIQNICDYLIKKEY